MIVRTLRDAGEAALFDRAVSRLLVGAGDGVEHALLDTSLSQGQRAAPLESALGGYGSQAHYCLSGHGIAEVVGWRHALSPGTVIAGPAGHRFVFEAQSEMRVATVLGTVPADDRLVVRRLDEIPGTERDVFWGNGRSRRLLVRSDGLGFALCVTQGDANTDSPLQYRNHFESCYYVSGSGEYVWDGGRHPIDTNGGVATVFVMNEHDAHRMVVHEETVCLSIFSPAIEGHERHSLAGRGPSSY